MNAVTVFFGSLLWSRACAQAQLRNARAYTDPHIGISDDDRSALAIMAKDENPLPAFIQSGWAITAARDAGYEAANHIVGCGLFGGGEIAAFQRRIAARFAEVLMEEARRTGLLESDRERDY